MIICLKRLFVSIYCIYTPYIYIYVCVYTRQHHATIGPSHIYSSVATGPHLLTGGTTPARCSCQLCGCTQGKGSINWTDPTEYKFGLEEGEKQSGTRPRLATLCGQNARLGRGALRGWTRPSYCLPLGSKKVIFNRELIIQHNEATE